MLKASENFTASEVRYLQSEATQFIESINESILKAAEKGDSEIHVPKYNSEKKYLEWTRAYAAIISHFEHRGFKVTNNGMTSIIISWKEEQVIVNSK